MPRYRDSRTTRKASVLLAVLVAVTLLSLVAYQFSDMMEQEHVAAVSALRQTQARALADSGIHYAAALLADPSSISGTLNNNTYDNETAFKAIQVDQVEEGRRTGRFSIVASVPPEDAVGKTFRYGVTDEAGKININALVKSDAAKAHDVLMKLPNMTDEIADSIVNWIQDPSKTPRPNGADTSYYTALSPSYRCKNGPLDSVEELLLVRGVTPDLLFGTDYNRNGIQDTGEDTGNGFDPGWAAYITVYSRFRNVDSTGASKLNLNDTVSQTSYDNLKTAVGQPLADFIMLAGASPQDLTAPNSDYNKSDGDVVQGRIQAIIQKGGKPSAALNSLWQLMDPSDKGKSVSITVQPPAGQPGRPGGGGGGGGRPKTVQVTNPLTPNSPNEQLLSTLLDKTTTKTGQELPARINVLSAPQQVLTCLTAYGTLADADVQNILSSRPSLSMGQPTDDKYKTTAWLLTEAKVSVANLRALDGVIGASTQVYRVQSLGYYDNGGPSARVEAVIDTNNGKPRIVMWRDLTELGKGYNLNQ
jgi:type II secretory pathway component PulK